MGKAGPRPAGRGSRHRCGGSPFPQGVSRGTQFIVRRGARPRSGRPPMVPREAHGGIRRRRTGVSPTTTAVSRRRSTQERGHTEVRTATQYRAIAANNEAIGPPRDVDPEGSHCSVGSTNIDVHTEVDETLLGVLVTVAKCGHLLVLPSANEGFGSVLEEGEGHQSTCRCRRPSSTPCGADCQRALGVRWHRTGRRDCQRDRLAALPRHESSLRRGTRVRGEDAGYLGIGHGVSVDGQAGFAKLLAEGLRSGPPQHHSYHDREQEQQPHPCNNPTDVVVHRVSIARQIWVHWRPLCRPVGHRS